MHQLVPTAPASVAYNRQNLQQNLMPPQSSNKRPRITHMHLKLLMEVALNFSGSWPLSAGPLQASATQDVIWRHGIEQHITKPLLKYH